jgi:hypothetical protein
MDRECAATVESLVSQWGGGSVLLENNVGKLMIVVSAVAEPLRPAIDPAIDVMPGQIVYRRGDALWTANLMEGSRHYCYPVHNSGMFAFAPTQAASLYLLLCRMLTWHFVDVSMMANTISEISNDEEKQVWDRLSLFAASTSHVDGVACCLRLVLVSLPYHNFGGEASTLAMRWDLLRLLLEYVRKRHLVSADCALSVDQERTLLKLLASEGSFKELRVMQQHPELVAREAVLSWLAHQAVPEGPESAEVQVALGSYCEDAGFDRVVDRTFVAEAGIMEWLSAAVHDVAYSRPEQPHMRGIDALRFLDGLFCASAGRTSANAPFPLIYELFTQTVSVEVNAAVNDDKSMLASILLRVVARDGSKSVGFSVLRALELNPKICVKMPKWGSDDLKWSFGIAGFTFDRDSTSKLLEAAAQRLRSLQPSLAWPRDYGLPTAGPRTVVVSAHDANHPRYWSGPLTKDAQCSAREFVVPMAEEFAGQPLAALAKRHLKTEKARRGAASGTEAARRILERFRGSDSTVLPPGGQAMVKRLLQDLQSSADSQADLLSLGSLEKLEAKERTLLSELAEKMSSDLEVASLPNGGGGG